MFKAFTLFLTILIGLSQSTVGQSPPSFPEQTSVTINGTTYSLQRIPSAFLFFGANSSTTVPLYDGVHTFDVDAAANTSAMQNANPPTTDPALSNVRLSSLLSQIGWTIKGLPPLPQKSYVWTNYFFQAEYSYLYPPPLQIGDEIEVHLKSETRVNIVVQCTIQRFVNDPYYGGYGYFIEQPALGVGDVYMTKLHAIELYKVIATSP